MRRRAYPLLAVLAALTRCTPAAPVPHTAARTSDYRCAADPAFRWRAAGEAAGAVLWAHGKSGETPGAEVPAPPLMRAFSAGGFDIYRFDRNPFVDDTLRAAAWLRHCLRALRDTGFRVLVAAGQSRGAWTALETAETPGAADAIVALSPAAQGTGASLRFTAQLDELRRIAARMPPSPVRIAVVQFADDLYAQDLDARARLFRRMGAKAGAFLLLDRPVGFSGHGAAITPAFSARYGACLVSFTLGAEVRC